MKCNKLLSGILSMVMAVGMLQAPTLAEDEIKVMLDGSELAFDVPPQIIDSRTMVPMRAIFEAMGAEVEWENSTKTISATKADISITMQIDNKEISVNGETIALDVPPQLVDSRTLVPARAVAESFEAKVEWDASTKTVVITTAEELPEITAIDLNKQTEFVCNVGATITYGYDDMWIKTVGTGYDPYVRVVDSAYRGQVVLIAPVYANFEINDDGYAKVIWSIKRKMPDGSEEYLAKDIVAIDGITMPKQIIKSMATIEYIMEDTDPLGKYIFTIESKDVLGNKTTENVFAVDFKEYEYKKNEFKSIEEWSEFIYNYAKDPAPERIIDAIIYAEKNGFTVYPVIYSEFIEMLAKNPYVAKLAVAEFEKEFGEGGTQMLKIIDNSAAEYFKVLMNSNPPTITRVVTADAVENNINFYGNAMGAYFASASYDAAKVLINSLADSEFDAQLMQEYGVLSIKELAEADRLFMAYCIYAVNYDDTVDADIKAKLAEILK